MCGVQADRIDTVLFALVVLLSLGKPLVVVGALDPVAVEGQQHRRQDHQEGKEKTHDQTHLTWGREHTEEQLGTTLGHCVSKCVCVCVS